MLVVARNDSTNASSPGDELRAVVGSDIGRDVAQDEEVGQDIDDVG